MSDLIICFFFFFQAEDGIRDRTVTGVQTCALPIFPYFQEAIELFRTRLGTGPGKPTDEQLSELLQTAESAVSCLSRLKRSEERRVGKECRSGGGTDHEKKKAKEKVTDNMC